MGIKYNGDEIFDPVMRVLLDDPRVGNDATRKVASRLIGELRRFEWDNPEVSLSAFGGSEPVVAAFAEHGILRNRLAEHPDDGEACEKDQGHELSHRDHLGRIWLGSIPGTSESAGE